MADAIEGAKVVGIQIDRLDGFIGEIHKEREHYELIQNAQSLKFTVELIRKHISRVEHQSSKLKERLIN